MRIYGYLYLSLLCTTLFVKLGLYRSVLQYGIKVITTSFKITIACCYYIFHVFSESDLPRSIMPIFLVVSNTFIITSRFLLKVMYSWDSQVNKENRSLYMGGLRLLNS